MPEGGMSQKPAKTALDLGFHSSNYVDDANGEWSFGRLIRQKELRELAISTVNKCKNDNPLGYSKWVCGKTLDAEGKLWRCPACLRFIDFFEIKEAELK